MTELKIEYSRNMTVDDCLCIGGFTAIDEDGNEYQFDFETHHAYFDEENPRFVTWFFDDFDLDAFEDISRIPWDKIVALTEIGSGSYDEECEEFEISNIDFFKIRERYYNEYDEEVIVRFDFPENGLRNVEEFY